MAVHRRWPTQGNTSSCGDKTCADGGPSSRIADCVRADEKPSAHTQSAILDKTQSQTAVAFILSADVGRNQSNTLKTSIYATFMPPVDNIRAVEAIVAE